MRCAFELESCFLSYFAYVYILQPFLSIGTEKGGPSQFSKLLSKSFNVCSFSKFWNYFLLEDLEKLKPTTLVSDRQNILNKNSSTRDSLSFLNDSLSFAFRHFGESFNAALNIPKAFKFSFDLNILGVYPSVTNDTDFWVTSLTKSCGYLISRQGFRFIALHENSLINIGNLYGVLKISQRTLEEEILKFQCF